MIVLKLNNKKIISALLIVIILITFFYGKASKVISTSTNPAIRLPIIMYHYILKNPKHWGKYVISPDDFESDIIYLKEKGYTTIVMQDLVDFVYNKKELPKKPIMLTLDDGFLTNYTYILPILEKHNCKAVVSIVGKYVDDCSDFSGCNRTYLNWDQVKELVKSPYIEIQNHSYNMHDENSRRGSCKKKGETNDEYRKALNEDVGKFQILIEEKTGYKPTSFTYPYGFISKESKQILIDMGFLATLSCNKGVNLLSGNKEDLYELKRFNRPKDINQEQFFKQFEN
ncbi:peptidoglycan/xylan/chitin deacetylase (PgdA/CDA1 family) [Sedimentibacter acidaminivorans]|uniref:Peptidoglycan/xylan/chitin deacetylase (PgdA/CDA1 family) n=1 Tax=Sedimentibacter acidaminivorans TaxID=913099 RepID=A0ABS4GFF0_9FIRM|nr:polysaccharide deacetylase family protein [Sedimentibacter acidaminivorans]MBP1926262.1 peptidoglycan/xylan/chitin deacetylase (PgdA/CDA1 family) [Sedimentibacter acidaminivorans]